MSTTFPLPLECLQLIIRQFVHSADGNTLAALLCVNKYVCSATLPIMYANPCRLRPVILFQDKRNKKNVGDLMSLVQLLLSSVSEGHITDMLRDSYFPDKTGQQGSHTIVYPSPSIPYYSFITELSFTCCDAYTDGIFSNSIIFERLGLGINKWIKNKEIITRYITEEELWAINLNANSYFDSPVPIWLRQELTRTLAVVRADYLQWIDIPISDISAYLPLIPCFKCLVNVQFLIDIDLVRYENMAKDKCSPQYLSWKARKDQRTQDLENIILFVQEHRRIHPNVLNMAYWKRAGKFGCECPIEIESRLAQSLPPLKYPEVLDKENWYYFIDKVQDTDVSLVTTIKMPMVTLSSLQELKDQGPFLHRCRSLQDISIYSWDEDLFQWAVDEHRVYRDTIANGRVPEQEPIRLEKVTISYFGNIVGRQINDILLAFGRTLESLSIDEIRLQSFVDEDEELKSWMQLLEIELRADLMIGVDSLNLDLPQLKSLYITLRDSQLLRIHSEFLLCCPQLTDIYLSDRIEEYSLDEIEYWTPANLPNLKNLHLHGTSALSFHPDTLHTTPRLKSLQLRMTPDSREDPPPYIPPVEEFATVETTVGLLDNSESSSTLSHQLLREHPAWTWDWDLPNLVELTLGAEFAYRFQFRMLDKTPNLKRLIVNIESKSGIHARTLGIVDLIKPGFQHPLLATFLAQENDQPSDQKIYHGFDKYQDGFRAINGYDKGSLSEDNYDSDNEVDDEKNWSLPDNAYIKLPNLRELNLGGKWSLEERAKFILYGIVAPRITYIWR
ncbi:hypothetical protein FBU30_007232 [Linnemannia zychae]|nr:hypothetical protein FBU30_007232 [Linnemannia zychae]